MDADIPLSPIERGALFALMAAGGPLKENAELKERWGIAMAARHRTNLQELGLIASTKAPFSHRLTDKGWHWLQSQLSVRPPKGQMGLGPLYAVVSGLKRVTDSSGQTLEALFAQSPIHTAEEIPSHFNPIAEAAWSDADEALGVAMQNMDRLARALERARGGATPDAVALLNRVEPSIQLVVQSVKLAATKRQLASPVALGAVVEFDPVSHQADEALEPGTQVRVRKVPVLRGRTGSQAVIVKAEVEPI